MTSVTKRNLISFGKGIEGAQLLKPSSCANEPENVTEYIKYLTISYYTRS